MGSDTKILNISLEDLDQKNTGNSLKQTRSHLINKLKKTSHRVYSEVDWLRSSGNLKKYWAKKIINKQTGIEQKWSYVVVKVKK